MNTIKTTDHNIAAIDLGSNSFHMVIAREGEQGNIIIIDRVREMVRLGAGLNDNGVLSMEAQHNALECLQRFRQRLHSISPNRIRAVGTNTLRAAKNSRDFLNLAEEALGHPISVISGHEEARLVYLGAAFDLAGSGRKRLVVDIGGGSTELVIGEGYKPLYMDSLYIGCVSLTRKLFNDGDITSARFQLAKNIVRRELEPVLSVYRSIGWEEAVGTSGTIKAIDRLARSLGMKQDWICPESIELITAWMIKAGTVDNLNHISEQRRPVFPGGFIILSTIFEELSIERMDTSEGALREGVAYDLIGRLHDEDSRFLGVDTLAALFNADPQQSKRVCQLAMLFLAQVQYKWKLSDEIDRKLLMWASSLHEIGISIAYSQHHSHGAYIIENSNMDGFSRQVQRVLALLVRNHRQKIDIEQVKWLPKKWPTKVIRLTIILRLAVAFVRGRLDMDLSGVQLFVDKENVTIRLAKDWAEKHPLTLFDLETEQAYLDSVGYKLEVELN